MTLKRFLVFIFGILMNTTICTFISCSSDDSEDSPQQHEQDDSDEDDKGSKGTSLPEDTGSNNFTDLVVSGGCKSLGYTSITLHGYVNNATPNSMGIVYSEDPDLNYAEYTYATSFDAGTDNRRFTVTINDLSPGNTYYYCAFIKIGSLEYRANSIYSFRTNDVVNILKNPTVTNITFTSAVVESSPSPTDIIDELTSSSGITLGVVYSKYKEAFESRPGQYYRKDSVYTSHYNPTMNVYYNQEKNVFSASLLNLEPSTTYYYRTYTSMNGRSKYGAVRQFNTETIPNVLQLNNIEGPYYNSITFNFTISDQNAISKLQTYFYNYRFLLAFCRTSMHAENWSGYSGGTSYYEDECLAYIENYYDNTYSVTINNIQPQTDYYWAIYIEYYDNYYTSGMTRISPVQKITP